MNRRTVLRTAGVAATVGLSGCIDAFEEHYQGSFQGLIPIEIHSETSRHYDLRMEAYDSESNRQTYDESYTVTADQSVTPPHLSATEQFFRVTKFGEDDEVQSVEETLVTENTKLVTIRLTDDDLALEIDRDENGADGPSPEPPTNDSGTNGSTPDDGSNDTTTESAE
ncbi:hypothetical protein [Natrinema salinisoli]|uniref:hypothetical protein n=1 Tax=Natrinema salinisoli TaxID=2878535 RepID=UPI001CF01F35|nr:hypothetical protein [Natrinema salinisoli]